MMSQTNPASFARDSPHVGTRGNLPTGTGSKSRDTSASATANSSSSDVADDHSPGVVSVDPFPVGSPRVLLQSAKEHSSKSLLGQPSQPAYYKPASETDLRRNQPAAAYKPASETDLRRSLAGGNRLQSSPDPPRVPPLALSRVRDQGPSIAVNDAASDSHVRLSRGQSEFAPPVPPLLAHRSHDGITFPLLRPPYARPPDPRNGERASLELQSPVWSYGSPYEEAPTDVTSRGKVAERDSARSKVAERDSARSIRTDLKKNISPRASADLKSPRPMETVPRTVDTRMLATELKSPRPTETSPRTVDTRMLPTELKSPRPRSPRPKSPVPGAEAKMFAADKSLSFSGGKHLESTASSVPLRKPTRADTLFARASLSPPPPSPVRSQGEFLVEDDNGSPPKRPVKWYDTALVVFLLNFTGFMRRQQEAFRGRLPLHFLDTLFRGIGQVVFCENPLTGLAVIAAMLCDSPWTCMLAAVGVTTSTLIARLLGFDSSSVESGLHGLNGFLVGGAVGAYMEHTWQAAVLVVPLGLAVSFMQEALRHVTGMFKVPALTLPYIAVYLMFHFAVMGQPHFVTTFPAPKLDARDGAAADGSLTSTAIYFQSFACGVARIFFCKWWGSGVIILGGMLLCSPILSIMCFVGSALGILTGVMCGAAEATIMSGEWGFNAALGAIAVVSFFVPTIQCFMLAIFAAWNCALTSAAFSHFLVPHGAPALMLGYVFGVLPPLLLAGRTSALVHVRELWQELEEVWEAGRFSPPEHHLQMYRAQGRPVSPIMAIVAGLHPAVIMSQVGVRKPRLPERMLKRLVQKTMYSDKELNNRFNAFMKNFSRDGISPADLEKLYCKVFPVGRAEEFVKILFSRFDKNGDGRMTFEEFITTSDVISHGSIIDRLTWVFELYGGCENGRVTREDIIRVLHAVYLLLDDSGIQLPADPLQYAEAFFQKITKGDPEVESFSLDDFVEALSRDDELVDALKVYDHV